MEYQRYMASLGFLRMLTLEKSKKPKLIISEWQLLFIIILYYSPLNKTPMRVLIVFFYLFVCLFSYASTVKFRTMNWLGHKIGPKTRMGISMSRLIIVICSKYLPLCTCIRCWGQEILINKFLHKLFPNKRINIQASCRFIHNCGYKNCLCYINILKSTVTKNAQTYCLCRTFMTNIVA